MKTIQEIKTDIDVLVRKQGNQGALKLGDVLDDFVAYLGIINKMMVNIPDVETFRAAVPNTATKIVFAYYGGVNLTGYTQSGNIGNDIAVYVNGTQYVVVSCKTIFAPENSEEFFYNYSALTSIDLSNFDTSNVISFYRMFGGCSGLTSLDLSNFDTSNVISFYRMFSGCSGLTSLDLSNFDTAKATTFTSMFSGCSGLTSLDLSNFDTAKATTFQYMFGGCSGLTSLDLSNFDTAKATTFQSMFNGCRNLTSLDLSNFDTAKATTFTSMFGDCSGLTTIIANDWNPSDTSINMFSGCTSLVGGNGTTYNSSHIDAAYAHIDVADNPGYFTAPA